MKNIADRRAGRADFRPERPNRRREKFKMKRIAALFVGAAMLLGLAACSDIAPADASLSESSAQASAPEESASEATAEESTLSESSAEATPAPQEAEGGKTLVVYYSGDRQYGGSRQLHRRGDRRRPVRARARRTVFAGGSGLDRQRQPCRLRARQPGRPRR